MSRTSDFSVPTPLASENEQPRRQIRPFKSLWDHKLLIFITFSLIFGIGLVFVLQMPPMYYAEAELEVLPNYIGNLRQDRELEFGRSNAFIKTQVHAINDFNIFLDAILMMRKGNREGNSISEADIANIQEIQNTIEIEQVPGTYRILVRLAKEQPAGLAETVNGIVQVYQDKMVKNKFVGKDVRVKNLNERKIELQGELHALTARKSRLVEGLGPLSVGEQMKNPYDQILLRIMESHDEARRNLINLENSFAVLERRLENYSSEIGESPVSVSDQQLDQDPYYRALRNKLNDKIAALRSQLGSLPFTHPGRSAIEQDLETLENQLDRETEIVKKKLADEIRKKEKANLELEIEILNEKISEAKLLENRLTTEMETQRKNLTNFNNLYDDLVEINGKIDRIRTQISAIDDRLDFFELEENAPGFVNVVSLARTPDSPGKGKQLKYLVFLLVAASGFSASLAIAIDYLNPIVKTPFDIEVILNHPPACWIPEHKDKRTAVTFSDQKRRLALSIERQFSRSGAKCFVLTSVRPGGGTTGITLALAKELTRIGIKALAVETNAFKPDAAYCQDDSGSKGLISVLMEKIPFQEVILPETETLPARIPVGDILSRRNHYLDQELFSLHRIFTLEVHELSSEYDVILFDAPSILASSDAELVAHHADALLLIVEAGQITQDELKKSVEVIRQIAPKTFAIILNRVRIKPGPGYFSNLIKYLFTGSGQNTRRRRV